MEGSIKVVLMVSDGVEVEPAVGADETVFDIGEVLLWVGQNDASEEGLEQATTVLGVVGGDTTV